jgi:hypothetical protein
VAPWLAGKLGEHASVHAPFWMGAGAVTVGVLILLAGRRHLGVHEVPEHSVEEGELLAAADVD